MWKCITNPYPSLLGDSITGKYTCSSVDYYITSSNKIRCLLYIFTKLSFIFHLMADVLCYLRCVEAWVKPRPRPVVRRRGCCFSLIWLVVIQYDTNSFPNIDWYISSPVFIASWSWWFKWTLNGSQGPCSGTASILHNPSFTSTLSLFSCSMCCAGLRFMLCLWGPLPPLYCPVMMREIKD